MNSTVVSTGQRRIAELAVRHPEVGFTSLNQYINETWMREAYRRTRKDGAVGVDGETASDFETALEANLRQLVDDAKTGRYRAQPVRRAHIPKGQGATRPLGIPALRDKILQRQVVMILEPIYETVFHDFSYGFRPGRSAHDALHALYEELMPRGGWVLDVDIRRFFDTLDHGHLRKFLQARVRDGVIRRLIDKWLKAGVMEGGAVSYSETGTPQGGVISPLLANIYLHEVLDDWFIHDVQPRLEGRSAMVRYADDFVMVFQTRRDAERVLAVLPKRLGRYGLTLHPEKTRLVQFPRPDSRTSSDRDGTNELARTFDFLGFTHYWGRSRRGVMVVKRKTARDRLARSLQAITDWCRRHLHMSIGEQAAALRSKLRGHEQYYGITSNYRSLRQFHRRVRRIWRFWLNRRTRGRPMTWERFASLPSKLTLHAPRVRRSVYRTQ